MATFMSGASARVIGNGVNLGALADTFTAEGTYQTSDATPLDLNDSLGRGTRFTIGAASGTYKSEGFAATESVALLQDGSHEMIARAFKSSGVIVAAPVGDTIGFPAVGLVAGITRASEPLNVGDTVGWSIDGMTQNGFEPGVVALPWTTQTGPFTGGVLDGGAVTSLGAAVFIAFGKFVGTSAVVKVQHATTSGGTYADVATFTTITAGRGGERVLIAPGTLNQFVKVIATGTFTALELIVAISRK